MRGFSQPGELSPGNWRGRFGLVTSEVKSLQFYPMITSIEWVSEPFYPAWVSADLGSRPSRWSFVDLLNGMSNQVIGS
jgi:hypothetical protein